VFSQIDVTQICFMGRCYSPDDPSVVLNTRRHLQSASASSAPPPCVTTTISFVRYMTNCTSDVNSTKQDTSVNCSRNAGVDFVRQTEMQFYLVFGGPAGALGGNATNATLANSTNTTGVNASSLPTCTPSIQVTRLYSPPMPPPSPPPSPPPPMLPDATAALCACETESDVRLDDMHLRHFFLGLPPIPLQSSCDMAWPSSSPRCSLSLVNRAIREGRLYAADIINGTSESACLRAIVRVCVCPQHMAPNLTCATPP